MYEVVYAQSARKSLKRKRRSGSFPDPAFKKLLALFMKGEPLPAQYKDHELGGYLSEFRECHLTFDLLVMYKRNEYLQIVTIKNVGTHPELFG